MSHSRDPVSLSPTDILAQCCVAFGKGAATYDITDEALHSMADYYLGALSRVTTPLDLAARDALLRNAEELGRRCGGAGEPISSALIKDALDELKQEWRKGFIPICLCSEGKP